MYTLAEYVGSAYVNDWGTLWLALGNFLDDFKREPKIERLETPLRPFDLRTDAFLAGVAEHLARQYQLPLPQWAGESKYYLEKPFFPCGSTGDYRIFLLIESPVAFKSRNIFVAENVLSRA